MIVVSVCLPSDVLSQQLPSYFGFSYLERGVSLHGCSNKEQPLLLTLDVGHLLMGAPPDLGHGLATLCCPYPMQQMCGKKSKINVDTDVEKFGPSYTAGGNLN